MKDNVSNVARDRAHRVLALLLALGISACGSSGSNQPGRSDAATGTVADAGDRSKLDSGSSDAAETLPPWPPSQFEEALGCDWMIEAGAEKYYCVYKTLDEDLWVSDFRPEAPAGTHHVSLGYIDPGPADGQVEAGNSSGQCDGITLGDHLAYVAVFNTQGFSMPMGVAVKLPAGKQVMLSVHVLNVGEEPLSGRTGVEIVRREAKEVTQEAEMMFANNAALAVPPGRSTHLNTCTLVADGTILGMFNHMHLTGVHGRTWVEPVTGQPHTLLDGPFDFDNQAIKAFDPPILVHRGDKIRNECTFENLDSRTLRFGESTVNNEMCLVGFYRFPAVAGNYNCYN